MGWRGAVALVTRPANLPESELIDAILSAFPGAHVTVNGARAMNELSQNEIQAIEAASDRGGAYLDAIKKSDLATMSREEWMTFVEKVTLGFADTMAGLHTPYAVLRSKDDPMRPITTDEVPY